MNGQDQVMASINEAMAVQQSGDNATARALFTELWARVGEHGDPLHRCVIGHYMADAQDEPADKLHWDQRALAAADELTDERAQRYHDSLSVRGFYPSLHLNLAQDHVLLGDHDLAEVHIQLAMGTLSELPEGGYRSTIEQALARLAQAVAADGR